VVDHPVVGLHRYEPDGTATLVGSTGDAPPTGAETVRAPIAIDGRTWGFIAVGGEPGRPLPPGTEQRLAGFTELAATAIADSQARERLAQLAEEQAALRRVATLVARGAAPAAVFAAVGDEVAQLFGTDEAAAAVDERLTKFTELVGMAIANAESREEL